MSLSPTRSGTQPRRAGHAVAAQPGRHHPLHLLGGVEAVDAAGLLVGGVAVAPRVVGAAEGHVGRRVLALQGRGRRVGHREAAARAAGRDRERVGAGVRRGARAVGDLLAALEDRAVARVDVHELPRRLATLGGAADLGLPGEGGAVALPDHEAGLGHVGDLGDAAAGRLDGAVPAHGRGGRGEVDRTVLGDGRGEHVTGRVGDDDEVAADDRQALVGALVGDRAGVVGAGQRAGADEGVTAGLLDLAGVLVDPGARGVLGEPAAVSGGRDGLLGGRRARGGDG